MVGNVSSNPYNVSQNNNVNEATRVHKHHHAHRAHQNQNNNAQKPDAVSGATKKNGGDHYFDTKA